MILRELSKTKHQVHIFLKLMFPLDLKDKIQSTAPIQEDTCQRTSVIKSVLKTKDAGQLQFKAVSRDYSSSYRQELKKLRFKQSFFLQEIFLTIMQTFFSGKEIIMQKKCYHWKRNQIQTTFQILSLARKRLSEKHHKCYEIKKAKKTKEVSQKILQTTCFLKHKSFRWTPLG